MSEEKDSNCHIYSSITTLVIILILGINQGGFFSSFIPMFCGFLFGIGLVGAISYGLARGINRLTPSYGVGDLTIGINAIILGIITSGFAYKMIIRSANLVYNPHLNYLAICFLGFGLISIILGLFKIVTTERLKTSVCVCSEEDCHERKR